jgi:DNA-directed RNA polymerase specialized sigma24 family protein
MATVTSDEALHGKDALLALPGEQRRAIETAYFGGLTRREIALEIAVPMGQPEPHAARAAKSGLNFRMPIRT